MLADKLQKFPAQYHWAMADGALLQAISRNEPMVRGIQGSRLGRLVKMGQHLGLVWLLLSLIGMVELIRLLLRQRVSMRNGSSQAGNYPTRFFVGFGAGKEEELFSRYREKQAGRVGRLDQLNVGSLAVWHCVGIVSGLRSLARALADARIAIAVLPPELAPWRADFFTYVGMRAGYFAYMRAWFEILATKAGARLDEVAFLSADTAAFAAADAGIPTCYLQHGMIRHSTLLPGFTRVEALTTDEAAFLRTKLPTAQISLPAQTTHTLLPNHMEKEVLVASIYGETIYGETQFLSLIASFIDWATTKKLPVRIRPHPSENSILWHGYKEAGQVMIEKSDADIHQAMNRMRPRLMVSWFSTALLDALEYGIIPITVCEDDDCHVTDMVYPLYRRCLRWPRDAESIEKLLLDDEYYVSVLSRLRMGLREGGA